MHRVTRVGILATLCLVPLSVWFGHAAAQDAGSQEPDAPDASTQEPDTPDAGTHEPSARESESEARPGVGARMPQATLQTDDGPLEPGSDRNTGVEGRVVSRKPKEPLADAPVIAKGNDGKVRNVLTGPKGKYKLYLPPGKYDLVSLYDLYNGAEWRNVVVTRGAFRRVNFVLDRVSDKQAGVDEIEIAYLADTSSESAQLNIRKESVAVQDSISAQEISRSGDGSAESAVKRVVGVTIDDEGRIVIRGLGNRYNHVLLNGVPIPGVDPDLPSVKLDIFPTDIVSNLAVIKTARPNLPGSFSGGLLGIETASFPQSFQLKIGTSLGYNSLSTLKNRPDYSGGKRDWLGFDDGTRELPGFIGNDQVIASRTGRYQTLADFEPAGESFRNIWTPTTRRVLPKIGLNASMGNTVKLKKGRRVGYLAAFLYDVDQKIRTGFNRRLTFDPDGNAMTDLANFDYKKGKLEVQWGTFASAFLELGRDNQLTLVTLFSRAGEDETLLQAGLSEKDMLPSTKNSFDFVGRSIFFSQLLGDHRNLGDTRLRLRWSGYVSTGKRSQPDRRLLQQQDVSRSIPLATRFFSDLNQLGLGATTNLRFPLWQQAYGTVGGQVSVLSRDFQARRFEMKALGDQSLAGEAEDLFSEDGIGTVSVLRELTTPRDSYQATTNYYAAFAQLETPVANRLKLLGGARLEVFRQNVESRSPFPADTTEPEVTDRTDLDVLPSLSLAVELRDDMFLKASYGMTVIRPQTRELAPYQYVDFLRGWNIGGNPELKSSVIQNAELRYEWYFGKSDLLATTVFYKYFNDPIEFVVFSPTNQSAGYQNANNARLIGGELELRVGLGTLSKKLENFHFQGNVSVMRSKTSLPADERRSGRTERPLYNQSPYVTNLSLRFDDPVSGVAVGLVYNAFGRRIVEVGTSASDFDFPDVFQQPQHLLDLVASWRATDHLKLKAKWKNVLFEDNQFKQGNVIVKQENIGTSISVGAEYIY